MKLWHLLPIKDLPEEDNPWHSQYDKCFGMVVRAETETKAREIANEHAGCECHCWDEVIFPWLDERYTTCVELNRGGKEELVIRDYYYS